MTTERRHVLEDERQRMWQLWWLNRHDPALSAPLFFALCAYDLKLKGYGGE